MKPTQVSELPSTDNLSPAQRSHAMRQVKSKNTKPELRVRQLLQQLGYTGYRLHRRDIPGSPDIAWIGRKIAIFINGCFWHGHDCARGARKPQARAEYWRTKIVRTIERDAQNRDQLSAKGWRVLVLWECELHDDAWLASTLSSLFADHST